MIKVALYGLIRVLFEWAAPGPQWVGLLLLGVGALSGARPASLYALVQRELKRLLAFSSVENVGIIVAALGAAIVLFAVQQPAVGHRGVRARRCCTRSTTRRSRRMLFLAAGAFGQAAGSLALDHLGGLLRRMPWTGWSFVVGCAAIAGVPPLNGFASEWLTLQSLLHVGYSPTPGVSVAGALAMVGVAATAALAVFCFVKVIGLVAARRAAQRAGRRRARATRRHPHRPRLARLGLRGAGCRPGPDLPDAGRAGAGRRDPGVAAGTGAAEHRQPSDARPRGGAAARLHGRAARHERCAARLADPGLGVRTAGRAAAGLDVGGVHQAAAPGARGRPAA